MKKTKYKLPFVLNGKEFTLGNWTVKKHEEVLAETSKFEGKIDEKELDKKYRTLLILKGLHEIDPNVAEEDLTTLHPDDLLALYAAVYLQGKRGILAEDDNPFREKKGSKNSKTKTASK
jgi:hypothetical protein